MIKATAELIPTAEAAEYHGEIPTAFADLSAFSPLADMRGGRPKAPVPVRVEVEVLEESNMPSVATWMQSGRPPVTQGLELPQLERFRTLMAENHWPVHVARMLFDRPYAYDRIVLAHTSRNFELRTLALGLFKVYQQRSQNH
jgi:hypothetical protein